MVIKVVVEGHWCEYYVAADSRDTDAGLFRRPLSKFIKDIYRGTIELIDGFDSFADCEND